MTTYGHEGKITRLCPLCIRLVAITPITKRYQPHYVASRGSYCDASGWPEVDLDEFLAEHPTSEDSVI